MLSWSWPPHLNSTHYSAGSTIVQCRNRCRGPLPGFRASWTRLTLFLSPSGSHTCIYRIPQALQSSTAARPTITTFVILTTPRPVFRLSGRFRMDTATSFLCNRVTGSRARFANERNVIAQPCNSYKALTSRPAPLPSRDHCGASAGPGPNSSSGSTAKREPPADSTRVRNRLQSSPRSLEHPPEFLPVGVAMLQKRKQANDTLLWFKNGTTVRASQSSSGTCCATCRQWQRHEEEVVRHGLLDSFD